MHHSSYFLFISTDLPRSDGQEASPDNPIDVLRAAGPVKKPNKLAHSNVRGSKWISSAQGPVDPLVKQKGIFLGGKHGLLLYMQSPLFLCFCTLFSSLSDCQCYNEWNMLVRSELTSIFMKGRYHFSFLVISASR